MKVALTILGEPASKANSRQIVMMGKGPKARPGVIKSEKARDYEAAARLQIPTSARLMLRGPVRVTLRIFYASERPDLDESVVLDVLQARYSGTGEARFLITNGVYVNDRQVREKHVYHAIDRTNPRAEIEVEEIAAGLFAELAPPEPVVLKRARRAAERPAERTAMGADGNPF